MERKSTFREWMNEKRLISRITILKAGLLGSGCGAVLMIGVALIGFVF